MEIFNYKIPLLIVLILSIIVNVLFLSYTLTYNDVSTVYQKLSNFLTRMVEEKSGDKPENDVRLPAIYTKDKEYGKNSFYKNVKTKEDFESWKKLFNYTKYHIDNFPLTPVTKIQDTQKETYVQSKFEMSAVDGDTIIFYELLPKVSTSPYTALFILPGSGATGARDVIGEPTELSQFYYHDNIGRELVKEGYAVYVIEHRGYGERSLDIGNSCNRYNEMERVLTCPQEIFQKELASIGIDYVHLIFRDAAQVLKYIHSLDYVDSNRIGAVGLSMGGIMASVLSGNNPEIIKATVVASGTHAVSKGPYAPRLGVANFLCCDAVDKLAAAMPPRPLYVSFGNNEMGMFAWEAKTNYSGELLKTAYEILEAEDNLVYTVHSKPGHSYDIPTVLEFLNKFLKE